MLRQHQAPSPGAAKASPHHPSPPSSESASVSASTAPSPVPTTAISSSSAPTHLPTHIKKRLPRHGAKAQEKMADPAEDDRRPLLQTDLPTEGDDDQDNMSWSRRNQWVVFALASGACAAFNGVFAKLTTNDLTTNFAQGIAGFFGLTAIEGAIEFIVRCMFFGLNLAFNGVMWTLFTTALARGNSTTQVSIMNTSSNFFITAVLGLVIFSESLPPLWWLGAAMLVAGNVIIGRKDESASDEDGDDASSAASLAEDGLGVYQPVPQLDQVAEALRGEEKDDEDEDEDIAALGDLEEIEDTP